MMRDVIPVTGADDAPPHVTALAKALDAAAARARCSTLVAIMRALKKLERPRRLPQTSPLALVGPQSDCDQRISSFRVSTFQIYHVHDAISHKMVPF